MTNHPNRSRLPANRAANAFVVTYSKPGCDNHPYDCENFESAISRAAKLCGVAERTILRRYRANGGGQVGGREIGDDGVWIEEVAQ